MTTTLRRYQVTETPRLASALNAARSAWPQEQRTSRLIEKLAGVGAEMLKQDPTIAQSARLRALDSLTRFAPSMASPDYLDELREGWDD